MQTKQPVNIFLEYLILFLLVLGFALVATVLMFIIGYGMGYDVQVLMNGLNETSSVLERNLVRFFLFLNNGMMFLLPGLIYAHYRFPLFFADKNAETQDENAFSLLKLNKTPQVMNVAFGVLILFSSLPLVQYSMTLNKMIPLPEWMHGIESNTETLLKGLLKMDSTFETLFNLLVIALTPALGEEIIFRGIVQQHLTRIYQNFSPHFWIWVSGAIFSFIHLQFEGFLPRMLLGATLGYLFYYGKNLWIPIIAHFIHNGSQVLAYNAFKENGKEFEIDKMEMPWYAAAISLVIFVGLLYFYKENNKEMESEKIDIFR
jgi:uncharacterized protein